MSDEPNLQDLLGDGEDVIDPREEVTEEEWRKFMEAEDEEPEEETAEDEKPEYPRLEEDGSLSTELTVDQVVEYIDWIWKRERRGMSRPGLLKLTKVRETLHQLQKGIPMLAEVDEE